MKRFLFSFIALLCAITSNAQIGYQVSLLNTATGEPRANETVSCTATLSGQKSTIFTSTQNVTSNEFGVLSLTIGNADMFKNVDWAAELPLFVEVAVDGKTIAKSQVLSVPVAEYAKTTGTLTYENIGTKKIETSKYDDNGYIIFEKWYFSGKTATYEYWEKTKTEEYYCHRLTGTYYIDGNTVFGAVSYEGEYNYRNVFVGHYSIESDTIYISCLN